MTERDVDLRLARLHLRTGLVALARAELEAAAGAGSLDREALADLAEVRWRTGDLVGAGVAAEAHLAEGGEALAALVIAAEHRFADGRTEDAEATARMAMVAGPGAVRAVFAGLPASPVWAAVLDTEPGPGGPEVALERMAGSAPPRSEPTLSSAPPRSELTLGSAPSPPEPASAAHPSDADRWFSLARHAFREGRLEVTGAALGLALRFDPTAAGAVLRLLAELEESGTESAAIELLRGDALRLLGREAEARSAYARAEDLLRGSSRA